MMMEMIKAWRGLMMPMFVSTLDQCAASWLMKLGFSFSSSTPEQALFLRILTNLLRPHLTPKMKMMKKKAGRPCGMIAMMIVSLCRWRVTSG